MASSLFSMAIKPFKNKSTGNIESIEDSTAQIDSVTEQHKNNEYLDRGIRKDHWKPSSLRDTCYGCNKPFSFTERHHHCRRCGDLFCIKCSRFRTKLNNSALPDINGRLQKVCENCIEKDPQEIGHSYKHTDVFYALRHKLHGDSSSSGSKRSHGSSKTFNFDEELERIKEGMRNHAKKFILVKAVMDLKNLVRTPTWLKPARCMITKLQASCTTCNKEFGILQARNFCSICANSICVACSSADDVIVYIPDITGSCTVEISVVRVIGAPEKEPEQCFYVTVCTNCKNELESRQLSKIEQDNVEDLTGNWWLDFLNIRDKFKGVERQIDIYLPKYQDMIEALDDKRKIVNNNEKSNIQILAKAQGDLNDHFSTFILTVQKLKQFKPVTKSQMGVFKNFIRAKCEYYQENIFLFRQSKNKLEKLAPIETLKAIQDIVNRNAMNSAYLGITQLAYETLHLATMHSLPQDIFKNLASVQDEMEKDLENCIIITGDNWLEHKKLAEKLIEQQIKTHRFIKPSKALVNKYGKRYLITMKRDRCKNILEQVSMHLESKSSHREFQKSKEALKTIIHEMNLVES
ncbi:DgyrCDS6818 [Dimorphilus gyrociliatus]|uniref:DgyrCDS6818 n=1 Tax=Dimorphilus gyrociliatus TaxID=2664684 RepID=A0A7I8VP57_9ANNE|nr:DgyrCDS6818 [Dimorphilus gyrociliatus]